MTDLSAKLGSNLFHQLEKLRSEKGKITVEDAGAIVTQLMKAGNDSLLQKEIAVMIREIETAKSEVLSLSRGDQTNQQALSDASAHLDTVVKSTEEATNIFMDAADALGKIADGIGGEHEKQLRDISTKIYEACNFQDLTSQRIAKVIKLIRTLESHIHNLLRLFEIQDGAQPAKSGGGDDISLLNGPALPRDAVSQDDIDALFKSLGE